MCDGAEAILRSTGGLCNLSSVVIRPSDTLDDLKRKVRLAAIIGTIQSSLTDFKYLRKVWKNNAEEERLLGISLTGIMDHPIMSGKEIYDSGYTAIFGKEDITLEEVLTQLKQVAIETNIEWADILGINRSKQLTLIKPEGTSSQLVNSSSGIHPRFAKFYIRKVTQDAKDPVTKLLVDQGVPHQIRGEKYYFAFPIKSPEYSITKEELSPIQQLELWKTYRDHWCDGNPSQTIYYNDSNFTEVQNWVWKNWKSIGGLSFFPTDDNVYDIMPYTECTEDVYNEAISSFPTIDWSKLTDYESSDMTTSSQEINCAGGACEL